MFLTPIGWGIMIISAFTSWAVFPVAFFIAWYWFSSMDGDGQRARKSEPVAYNPATGLRMKNNSFDVGGNLYGEDDMFDAR